MILEFRKLSHLINVYLDPLPHFAFPDKRFHDEGTQLVNFVAQNCVNYNMLSLSLTGGKPMKRIFTTILQTAAATGRLAFTDPNLQSISHEVSFIPVSGELRFICSLLLQ